MDARPFQVTDRISTNRLDDLRLVRWSALAMIVSVIMLATAPLFIDPSYSAVQHTLSESGGQGVEHSWIFRSAVLLTSVAVMVLARAARSAWPRLGLLWLRIYAIGLIFVVLLPESPWNGPTPNQTAAYLHTVAGAGSAIAFILAVAAVAHTRARHLVGTRLFDLVTVLGVAVIPQVMLVMVDHDGILQRSAVGLGYAWLLIESMRLARSFAAPSDTSSDGPESEASPSP